jgi:hypothetical protein
VLLLADDVALEVHAHFDGLAALGGCAAPDASAVLLEPGNIGEAACLNPGFGLTLSEAVGQAPGLGGLFGVFTAGVLASRLAGGLC